MEDRMKEVNNKNNELEVKLKLKEKEMESLKQEME